MRYIKYKEQKKYNIFREEKIVANFFFFIYLSGYKKADGAVLMVIDPAGAGGVAVRIRP